MEVSELGEFGLIDLLAKMIDSSPLSQASHQQLIIGIGDDAAAWYDDTSVKLATVDSFVQDVHFSLDITSWDDLGWRAMAACISDIAAMGGVPRYALVSLALPGHTEVEDVTFLYRGMIELAQRFEVAVVGGDTTSAPLVTLSITVLGSTGSQRKEVLSRAGAKPGDKIAVTGYLGASSAGLEMLSKRLNFDHEAVASLKEAFLRPCPRIDEGRLLVKQGVRAAIDISDGLVSDLRHLCKASRVSARITVDDVPVHPDARANFGDESLELALSGGEDYELLFTAGDKVINKVMTVASCPITVIGEITADKAGEVKLLDGRGNQFSLSRAGWEHFVTG